MTVLVIILTLVILFYIIAWVIPTMIALFIEDLPWNWRAFSVYHYMSDVPNGYYAWLDKHYPGWWRRR